MGRKQKHPEHATEAQRLMNALLDEVVSVWTSEEEPELKAVAEEVEISPAKLRKLLITAGERDRTSYFSSPTADMILKLRGEGKSVKEMCEITGLSYTSVQGYLPHSKLIYNMDTMSAECERIRLYRARKRAISDLHDHLFLPDASFYLWKAIIDFQSYPFHTSGRGSREGVKFTYEVSKPTTAGGRRYEGEVVEGYGNEMWITTLPDKVRKEKSISRSTVDLVLKNALTVQAQEGFVGGPKKLNIPGAGSYLYPMFIRFGVINDNSSVE
jgi:hypothetical protein